MKWPIYVLATGVLMALSKRAGRTKSYLDREDLPRGMRNNNPGNLVYTSIPWRGKVPAGANTDAGMRFEQFVEYRWGVRALIKDLINDISEGTNTVKKLIYEFAPPFENLTDLYVRNVSNMAGVDPDSVIVPDKEILRPIVQAIGEIENGQIAITNQDFDQAWQLV